MKQSILEDTMADWLDEYDIEYTRQYRFFFFFWWMLDFAIMPLERKIGIEINGGGWVRGRHHRPLGYSKDLEKLNSALLHNWKILVYDQEWMKNKDYIMKQILTVLGGNDENLCKDTDN